MNITINPGNHVSGEISLPGDKSIWHRALIIGSLTKGKTQIFGEPAGVDVESTKTCLEMLGVDISSINGKCTVSGLGFNGFKQPESILQAGNSGTTVRLLSGVLAAQSFDSVIDGDPSLRKRPMMRIAAPLSDMGASITTTSSGGCPIRFEGGKSFNPIIYKMPVASAQVKSALLLAGLCADVDVSLIESHASRDHTEIMLQQHGIGVEKKGNEIILNSRTDLEPIDAYIPGDFSSAAFFIATALMLPESELIIKDVGLNPTRTGFLDIIKKMGANVETLNLKQKSGEMFGDLSIRSSELTSVTIRSEDIPSIIDELPLIGVLGATAEGTTRVSGASELRFKESDRISALVLGMRSLDVKIEEFEDGFEIKGKQKFAGGEVDSAGDHRLAMAFAVAGLASEKGINIKRADSVLVSYPSFFDDLGDILES